MLAALVAQEAQAFARALLDRADADVIEVAQAQAVQREGTAADIARKFLEGVVARLPAVGDAHEADAAGARLAQEPDRAP